MLFAIVAVALLVSSPSASQASAPGSAAVSASQVPAPPSSDDPVQIEDVVVDARRLEEASREFVGLVSAPVQNRGLARWRRGVCVGVVNMRTEAAQYIADRISTVALDVGLEAGEPGCDPNVVIIAADDGAAFARAYVAERPRIFRVGASGMDLGGHALRLFQESGQPVRWWHVSVPVDSDTNQVAVRLPGHVGGSEFGGAGMSVVDYAPKIVLTQGVSRLRTQIRDDLRRVYVIVDMNRLGGATLTQLGDYLSMIALAQIDLQADMSRYETVLNLFDSPSAVSGLTGWDTAYLDGLYRSRQTRLNPANQMDAIAASIRRSRLDAAAEDTAD